MENAGYELEQRPDYEWICQILGRKDIKRKHLETLSRSSITN